MAIPHLRSCKTLAKPISNQIKTQAKQYVTSRTFVISWLGLHSCKFLFHYLFNCHGYHRHDTFRTLCVGLAQRMHRFEVGLRTNLLGEPAKHIRPLSETRYVASFPIQYSALPIESDLSLNCVVQSRTVPTR